MPVAAVWHWPFKVESSDAEDHRIPRRGVSSSEIAGDAAALRRIDIGGGRLPVPHARMHQGSLRDG
jgi:hypothetical protein